MLGGDGTLISAATRLVRSRIPLIGVNLGTLGYLCELEENNVFEAIDRLMADDYLVGAEHDARGLWYQGRQAHGYKIALK